MLPQQGKPILVIDNHDSFVYNLIRYLRELGAPVEIREQDCLSMEEIHGLSPCGILLSPGPKRPGDVAMCLEVVRAFSGKVPILGVCLGHQVIASAFGGWVTEGESPVHGMNADILHDGKGVLAGLPNPFSATRYHSLVVREEGFPPCLEVTARTREGVVMGIRHRSLPVEGVQFHPEAERTQYGHRLLANFMRQCGLEPVKMDWYQEQVPLVTSLVDSMWLKEELAVHGNPDKTGSGFVPDVFPRIVPRFEDVVHVAEAERLFQRIQEGLGTVFLDSAAREVDVGAHSLVAWSPWCSLEERADGVVLTRFDSAGVVTETRILPGSALDAVQACLGKNRMESGGVQGFAGGAIGMIGYEARTSFDGEASLPVLTQDSYPTAWFWFHRHVAEFHHESGVCRLVWAGPETGEEAIRLCDEAKQLLSLADQEAGGPIASECERQSPPLSMPEGWKERFFSNFSEADYLVAVEKMRLYIRTGDIYLANMTRQFQARTEQSGFLLQQRLRRLNPAAFSAWFPFGRFELVSASPERFLSIRNRWVETRPIKGTRPRGNTPESDAANRAALAESLKDQAELLMVTDLERNDLSRVCEPGTVSVSNLFEIAEHPTVFHLVATVRGCLSNGQDAVDCMRACFPGGSITGTPKRRAMEVIRELEGIPRGPYTGCLGWFGFDGNADFSILIRTMVKEGPLVSFGVGGGITWDSVPADEEQETLDKAKALMAVLSMEE